jgi:transcriptional regulator GlxA family with amidase domain
MDHALASGIAVPIDIFMAANRIAAESESGNRRTNLFDWRVESIDGKPVRTASGQIVAVDGRINDRNSTDAIWVTGPFVSDINLFLSRPVLLVSLLDALRRQHERGTLIATYCTGAFLLAEAGLLNGRVATTHWSKVKSFNSRYPEVELRASEVLTEQDNIICSGAVTSYQNLALRVVEKLASARLASATAKVMLIDTNRASQDSFIDFNRMDRLEHDDQLVARAQRWMEKHLHEPFNLTSLSRHLAVSNRTLSRHFKLVLGEPPLKHLQTLRIEVAKRLLEKKQLSIDAVSERVGYIDMSSFRQLFKRVTGVSPGEYRRRFSR